MAMNVFVYHIWEKLLVREQLLSDSPNCHINVMVLMLLNDSQVKFIELPPPKKKNSTKNVDYQSSELSYSLGLNCIRLHKELPNNTQRVNHLKTQATEHHSNL